MFSHTKAMAILTASLLCAGSVGAQSTPVAGRAALGVAVVEMDAVVARWSVNRDILKKAVVNEKKEKIGTISDIVISPNADGKAPAASFAIVFVGGFLGIGKRDVAIPMEQIKLQDGTLTLAGATKDALKALPAFQYRHK